MGFYCVDNLPVELMPIFAELHAAGEGDFARAALLVDAREGVQLEKLPPLLKHLKKDHPMTLVFIEASEDALLRRPEQFVQTFTEGLLVYATGRTLQPYDMPAVRRMVRGAAGGDFKFSTLVQSVVRSEQFRMRRMPQPATIAQSSK